MWRSLKGSGYLGLLSTTALVRSFLRPRIDRVKARFSENSAAENDISRLWKFVVSKRRLREF